MKKEKRYKKPDLKPRAFLSQRSKVTACGSVVATCAHGVRSRFSPLNKKKADVEM